MAYYTALFSPETYFAFDGSDRSVSGFRIGQKNSASHVAPGDKLICYMTKLSRWVGVFEVTSPFYIDSTPIFTGPDDPFVVRFKVIPRVWLRPEQTVPINHDICWDHLSFTKQLPKNNRGWTAVVRGSLKKLDDTDGRYLETLLTKQTSSPETYALNEADKKKLKSAAAAVRDAHTSAPVPEDEPPSGSSQSQVEAEQYESIQMQAKLARMGERMGLNIWLPRADRQKVMQIWTPQSNSVLLDKLPLSYDDVTLRTIENIDVIWIRNHSIIRAFEVEHTTAIYSGILRMADLMALQPNLTINAHIVAPAERRSKVLQQISRPVFELLGDRPLSESCTYISYDTVSELFSDKNLEYISDAILDKYAEYAEEADG